MEKSEGKIPDNKLVEVMKKTQEETEKSEKALNKVSANLEESIKRLDYMKNINMQTNLIAGIMRMDRVDMLKYFAQKAAAPIVNVKSVHVININDKFINAKAYKDDKSLDKVIEAVKEAGKKIEKLSKPLDYLKEIVKLIGDMKKTEAPKKMSLKMTSQEETVKSHISGFNNSFKTSSAEELFQKEKNTEKKNSSIREATFKNHILGLKNSINPLGAEEFLHKEEEAALRLNKVREKAASNHVLSNKKSFKSSGMEEFINKEEESFKKFNNVKIDISNGDAISKIQKTKNGLKEILRLVKKPLLIIAKVTGLSAIKDKIIDFLSPGNLISQVGDSIKELSEKNKSAKEFLKTCKDLKGIFKDATFGSFGNGLVQGMLPGLKILLNTLKVGNGAVRDIRNSFMAAGKAVGSFAGNGAKALAKIIKSLNSDTKFKKMNLGQKLIYFIQKVLEQIKKWLDSGGKKKISKIVDDVLENLMDVIKQAVIKLTPVLVSIGLNIGGALLTGFGKAIKDSLIGKILIGDISNSSKNYNSIRTGAVINPKNKAIGMPYVPYDNYPAMLHQGERVMTAAENRQYKKGGSNITITIPKLADSINASSTQDINLLLGKLEERLMYVSANMGRA